MGLVVTFMVLSDHPKARGCGRGGGGRGKRDGVVPVDRPHYRKPKFLETLLGIFGGFPFPSYSLSVSAYASASECSHQTLPSDSVTVRHVLPCKVVCDMGCFWHGQKSQKTDTLAT